MAEWPNKPPIGSPIDFGDTLSEGLIARWIFNEGGGLAIRDALLNYLGSFNGGLNWVPGLHGSALSFNGTTGYVDLGAIIPVLGQYFTLAAWVKSPDVINTKNIFSSNNGTSAFHFRVGGAGSTYQAHTDSTVVAATNSGALVANQWQRVVYTKNGPGATHAIYINGQVQTLATNASLSYTDTTQPKHIGYRVTASPEYFNGVISDLGIWSRAWSANDVAQDYDETYRIFSDGSARKYFLFSTGGIKGQGQTLDPTTISGLVEWHDGTQGLYKDTAKTIVATANNDAIACWADLSGNGNDATQTTGANQPVLNTAIQNGKNAIKFSGSQALVSPYAAALTDLTAIIAFKDSGTNSASQRLLDKNFSGGFWIGENPADSSGIHTTSQWGGGVEQGGSPYGLFITVDNSLAHIIINQRSGTTQLVRIDGVETNQQTQTCSGSATDTTSLKIGASSSGGVSGFTGIILEVLIYNRALTDTELQEVEDYLRQKWLLTSSSGSTTWTASTSGGFVTSGTGSVTWAATQSTSGTIVTGGVNNIVSMSTSTNGGLVTGGSNNNVIISVPNSGGVVTGGTGSTAWTTATTSSGGVVVGGTSTYGNTYNITSSGGVVTGGTSNPVWISTAATSGGVVVGGTTTAGVTYVTISSSGGVVVGGKSVYGAQTYNLSTSGGVVTGGTSTYSYLAGWTTTGGVITGGTNSASQVMPFTTSGGVVTSGNNNPTVIFNQSNSGGFVTGGSSKVIINLITSGGTVIGGAANVISSFTTSTNGGFVLGGTSTSGNAYSITTDGGLIVGGTVSIISGDLGYLEVVIFDHLKIMDGLSFIGTVILDGLVF